MLNVFKRRVLIFIVILLLIVAVGTQCVIAENKESPYLKWWEGVKVVNTDQWMKEPPWTIGFSNASTSNDWRVSFTAHVEYQVTKYPEIENFYVTDANDDPAKQFADVEDLLAKGIDCLIISAATDVALNAAVDKAMAKGVPVVVVDRRVTTPNFVSFVSNSDEEIGRKSMEWLIEQINGKGKIIILSGTPGAGPAEARLEAIRKVLDKHPEVEVLATEYVQWSVVKSKEITASLIEKFGNEIDAIWTDGTGSNSGAIDAYIASGLPIPIIYGDDTNRFLKQWKQYKFNGLGGSVPVWMGMVAVDAAVDILKGLPVPHEIWVPSLYITNETLDQYLREDMPDGYLVDEKLPPEWEAKYFKK
jgi:ribose transport system substrate-binding protein